jgi:hypothetical protein
VTVPQNEESMPAAAAGGANAARSAIAGEFTGCCRDLRELLAGASAAELRAPSSGTRWTNEQVLFHMVFGFLVVRRLLPLVRLMGRLPGPVGRTFAALLNASARPFHVVNYVGSCAGALVFNRNRMSRLCDRTVAALIVALGKESDGGLPRGMPFPTRWDPYFTAFMTLESVYRYPVLHYRHHRAQLTLASLDRS